MAGFHQNNKVFKEKVVWGAGIQLVVELKEDGEGKDEGIAGWLGVCLWVQDGPVAAIDFLVPHPIPRQSEGSEVDKLPSPALGHIIVNSPR